MLVALCSILGFFGTTHWMLDLLSHFRVQYAVLLVLCVFALVVARSWRAGVICGLFAAINVGLLVPFYVDRHATPQHSNIRILLINVNFENQQAERVMALIRETRPDVIVVEEVNRWWAGQLDELNVDFPHEVQSIQEGPFGIAVFSREPFFDSRIVSLGEASGPSILVRRRLGSTVLNILAIHAFPPLREGGTRLRNSQLEAAAHFIAEQQGPTVLVGDLNITPWSPYFHKLLDTSGLTNGSRGNGIAATWPTDFFPARIPLDHHLVSRELVVLRRAVQEDVGSDHFPVFADIALRAR